MKKTGFSRRYFFLPFILIVFCILFILIYKDIKERTIDEFNNEQLILAQTASQGITSFFNDYQADLVFLSGIKDIIDNNGESRSLMANFYEHHKNYFEAVTRVDAHGVILCTYPRNESVIGKDISDQKHVRQIIATHQPVISDVFKSAQGFQAIALHVPIFKGREYAGSLAMLISIDRLGKLYLGKIRIRGTGTVWLLSENGVEIFCPLKSHIGNSFLDNTNHDSSAITLLAKTVNEDHGTGISAHQGMSLDGKTNIDKRYVVFYRAPLGNTYWTILISYEEEDIYVALTHLRNRLILAFALLFIIISYYFYSIAKVRNVLREEAKRKAAERTIRESEERFKKLSELSYEGIVIHNNGIGMDTNDSFVQMVGYSREELIGCNVIELLVIPEFQEIIRKNLKEKSPAPYEVVIRRKNGSFFPAELVAREIKYKGEILRVAAMRNISDRKKQEKELLEAKERAQESDRLKSAFLANMSHEIRTPMNGILGFASLLKEPGLNGEEQKEYIRIIERSGTRMLNIINDIIDISKIESGMMEVSLSETNINDQVEFIYNFFKHEAEDKGLYISRKISLAPNNAIIITDREKLYAILSNLVKNAVKYTNEGLIELGYSQSSDVLEFFVKDTGIGIPKNRQAAIFERFIQADISNKMAQQGAGLGLSITKAYVEVLGGRIRVESETGKGSVFYFTLPYKTVPPGIVTNDSESFADSDSEHSGNLKILVAEDDDASALLISHLLKKFRREIIIAKTGIETVELCRDHPDLDLVLMDMQMPVMNGYEATRQIRVFNKNVIIIAQTAYAFSGDREKATGAGCNDYIVKPLTKKELLDLILKYFSN